MKKLQAIRVSRVRNSSIIKLQKIKGNFFFKFFKNLTILVKIQRDLELES